MESILNQTIELNSGVSMPVFGLGTWKLTGPTCEQTVRKAVELGYRHIDTAEMYDNEGEVGRGIRGFDRSGLFLTSKVDSANLETYDVLKACDQSLGRLGTDYLDLYLLHWPNDAIPLERTMEGMQTLLAQGKIRSIGVSNFDIGRLKKAIAASDAPVCNNQVEYHPFRPRYEIPQFCRKHGIAFTAYCPLARGKVLQDPTLQEIGRKYDKSAAQVSLAWLLSKGAVVIPKASGEDHLKTNADLDGWELAQEDIEAIDGLGVEQKLVDVHYT